MPSLAAAGLFLLSFSLLYLSSPGMDHSLLIWFGLTPLLFAARRLPPRRSFWLCWFAAIIYYSTLLRWLTISLNQYGNLSLILSYLALILLACYLALFPAIFATAISRQTKTSLLWSAPIIWIALDYLRAILFTGFPWLDLGYSQYNQPLLLPMASIAGHHAITFIIIMVNCLIFSIADLATRDKWSLRRHGPYLAGLLFLGTTMFWCVGKHHDIINTIDNKPTFKTAVIQASIEQDQKWKPDNRQQSIRKHLQLSEQALAGGEVQLVIWPETAIPFTLFSSSLFRELETWTRDNNSHDLLAGIPYLSRNKDSTSLYNSAILLADKKNNLYHKQHLVPFGEYFPFSDLLPLPGPLVSATGNFKSGPPAPPLVSGPARLGVLICFESIFPEIARAHTMAGANLLINITNDGWFGPSAASKQHLSMAVLRAVENQRSLARAANTGISCYIDPAGRIHQETRLFTPTFISKKQTLCTNLTFFSRHGHHFPLLCLFISMALLIRQIMVRKTANHS